MGVSGFPAFGKDEYRLLVCGRRCRALLITADQRNGQRSPTLAGAVIGSAARTGGAADRYRPTLRNKTPPKAIRSRTRTPL